MHRFFSFCLLFHTSANMAFSNCSLWFQTALEALFPVWVADRELLLVKNRSVYLHQLILIVCGYGKEDEDAEMTSSAFSELIFFKVFTEKSNSALLFQTATF